MVGYSDAELEELYGPRSAHSEHPVGTFILYKKTDEEPTGGLIIWICAPRPGGDPPLRLVYVVLNGESNAPEFVFPADVLSS
jgi:hypothetical protein